MSIYRRAAKVDTVQADIVKGLKSHGIEVFITRRPSDLLLNFRCSKHEFYCWHTMEIKTPTGKKKPSARIDRRQVTQNKFLETTNTIVAISLEDALRKLSVLHRLPGIEISCVLKPSAIAVRR